MSVRATASALVAKIQVLTMFGLSLRRATTVPAGCHGFRSDCGRAAPCGSPRVQFRCGRNYSLPPAFLDARRVVRRQIASHILNPREQVFQQRRDGVNPLAVTERLVENATLAVA